MAQPGSRRSSHAGLHSGQSSSKNPATSSNQVPVREPKPSEKIPFLSSTLPAIFVPFNEDPTQETSIPRRDRVERLKHIIDTIDHQRVSVRENLMWLLEREKERMTLQAKEREQEFNPEGLNSKAGGISAAEVDHVIHCLEAPAVPGHDYNVTDVPHINPHRVIPPTLSPRDAVVEYLLSWMESGSQDLSGYEGHIVAIRRHYEELLQKEIARIQAVGMRPEDRPKMPDAMMM